MNFKIGWVEREIFKRIYKGYFYLYKVLKYMKLSIIRILVWMDMVWIIYGWNYKEKRGSD